MQVGERRLAMLREMGIRVWAPRAGPEPAGLGEGRAAAVGQSSAPHIAAEAGRTAEAPPDVRPAPAVAAERLPPGPASPAPVAALARADWLVVMEPFEAGGDLAAAADLERLLDNMLASIRASRQAPTPAGRAAHLALSRGDAIDLDAAIAAVAPRGILALGRDAADALLGIDEPIGRLRDRVHARNGIPVVVTFSLTYLLRHSADKARAWADLCRAVAAVG
jgi:DNA polymerase